MDGVLNSRDICQGIARDTGVNSDTRIVILEQWKIDKWLGLLVEGVDIAIVSDPYHREPLVVSAKALAKGVRIRPVPPGEFLIDDGHELRCVSIAQREFAASHERDLHRL